MHDLYKMQKQSARGVLKNLTKFTGKHLCWSLCSVKLQVFRPATLLKKRLQYRCFPVNIAKLLRTRILKNIFDRLLLKCISCVKCKTEDLKLKTAGCVCRGEEGGGGGSN